MKLFMKRTLAGLTGSVGPARVQRVEPFRKPFTTIGYSIAVDQETPWFTWPFARMVSAAIGLAAIFVQ